MKKIKMLIIATVIIIVVLLLPGMLYYNMKSENQLYLDNKFVTYSSIPLLVGGPYQKTVDNVAISVVEENYFLKGKYMASLSYTPKNQDEIITLFISSKNTYQIWFSNSNITDCPINPENLELDKNSPTYIFTCKEIEDKIKTNTDSIEKIIRVYQENVESLYR
ncbi:MAG: hypothetical protein ACRCUP_07000 [Mycoplasmatales bacterium]